MKSLYLQKILFVTVVAALCGCTSGDGDEAFAGGERETSGTASKLGGISETLIIGDSVWGDDAATRSIFFGGSNGNRFFMVWDTYDKPVVYLGEDFLGQLKPKETGVSTTTLSGKLTGTFKVGDQLSIYSPSFLCDFTGQDGTIAGMSSQFSFMTATATVASVKNTTVTTTDMTFKSFACYVTFTLTDENDRLLHVKRLTITTADRKEDGTLAETMDLISGENTKTNEYVINVSKEKNTDDYPTAVYVVMYDLGSAKSTFTLTALASDGKTYQAKNYFSYLFNVGGQHFAVPAKLSCIDVEAGVSTGIVPPTDEDVQIDDVVKE